MRLLDQPIGRRSFLRLLFWTPIAFLLARLMPWGCAPFSEQPAGLKVLDAQEYKILQALARIWIPEGGGIPYSGYDIDVPRLLDEWLRLWPKEIAVAMKGVIRAIEWLPFWIIGRWSRMTRLRPDLQEAYLHRWSHHRSYHLRSLIDSVRLLTLNAFYRSPKVKKELGYQLLCG